MIGSLLRLRTLLLALPAGLALGCAGPAREPAPPSATGSDTVRDTTILKPFAVPEILPDTDLPPPEPPRLPPPPPDTFPLLRARDSATSERRATAQLDTLQQAGSLLKWRRHHPDETIELAQDNRDLDSGLGLPLEGGWCARAVRRERLRDGRVVLRSVFFYPPDSATPTPEGDAPVGAEAVAECRAGAISLQSEELDSDIGDSLALTVRRRLTTRYGKGRAGARLPPGRQ